MDNPGYRYSIEAVNRFLGRFETEEMKDAAMSALQSKKVLEGFLETTEGRVLIDDVMNGVRKDAARIIGMCIEGFDKNTDQIRQASMLIGTALTFLTGIRTKYDLAEGYEAAIANEEAKR